MVDVDAQDVLELPAACNQKPVETVAADSADPALGDGVRPQELTPAEPSARASGRHARQAKDLGDRCRRNPHADTRQLADYPLTSPARVLTRKTQNELTDLLRQRRPTRLPRRVRPPPPYKLAMPAKQRVRTDEERLLARSAQQSAGRSKEHAVVLLKPRAGDLAAQNRQL